MPVLICRTEGKGVRYFDIAAMFASLGLLTAMILDVVTPPELTVFMIGAAIAPATVISATLYWLRVPAIDFAVVFATLWMITEMALEIMTPVRLSPLMAVVAVVPSVMVGTVIQFQYWRRSRFGTVTQPRRPGWVPDTHEPT